ncbi:MAG: hypothetical protein ABI454_08880 [Sphingomicrobium sp.]
MQTTEPCFAQPYSATLKAEPTASLGRYPQHRHDYVDVFFKSLTAWRSETAHLSFAEDKIASPHFQKIVSLGEHVVPLIVNELRHEPSFLFLALEEITGEDHVAPNSYGKPKEMVNDWLQWYQNVGVNAS